jgi:type IV secretory pathway VirD2 relaxase
MMKKKKKVYVTKFFNFLDYTTLNEWFVNDELEELWKVAIVVNFKKNSLEGLRKNHEKAQSV